MQSGHSDTTTEGIRVRVAAQFLPERSSPEMGQYFFVYRVRLSNEGEHAAKLLTRYWLITDANGKTEEVEGPGVVGDFPDLAPGESYEYMSGCPLGTEWGTMEGHYVFEREGGERFQAGVGRFFLALTTAPITSQD
ncbi:MAG: Co2+/Mg2+ efflux protein ApaG [Planctomycetes bacterium]|nr:Co2+/Mg2+ efflux protein ApaG [Planctomycetota bacterium]